ncbi:MAG: DUF4105 domain-containing protein [Leptospiraceae bacterium]|nr:DUF4105 domain-containing protein [Leptospiraceae bacterium]
MKRLFYLPFLIYCLSFVLFAEEKNPKESWRKESFQYFLKMVPSLSENQIKSAKVQLVTVSPGITVTTAFGHSAIRVILGKEFSKEDFYIDFGEYEPSISFLYSLLKGNAKFFVNVLPMESAHNAWDSSGRGMLVSDLNLNAEQKKKFFQTVLKKIEDNKEGYEYNNFTNNCVTFSRDLLGEAFGKRIELKEVSDKTNTWRKRVLPYSNQIVWLRINEKLLFDRDTDKIRDKHDLIYLPLDLYEALKDNKFLSGDKVLIQDRWGTQSTLDISGKMGFILFIFAVLTQLPIKRLSSYERTGRILFGLMSGLGGLVATFVWIFTTFDFMDETLMVLVFTPFDFILVKRLQSSKPLLYYSGLRLGLLFLALVLRFTTYPQNIDTSLFFSILFFAGVFYKSFISNKTPQSA